MTPERFLSGIRKLAETLCEGAKSAPSNIQFEREPQKSGKGGRGGRAKQAGIGKCPLCQHGAVLENSKAFYCSRYQEGCGLTMWKDAASRHGGPALTAELMKRALADGRVVGSTGTLVREGGRVWFEPKPGR
jgi:DNA topoisomerase-3